MTAINQAQVPMLLESRDINYQKDFYLVNDNREYNLYNGGSLSSSGSGIESNLLEDLWLVPSNTTSMSSGSLSNYSPLHKCTSRSPIMLASDVSKLRDEGSFYLPNQLMNELPSLTEDNLSLCNNISFNGVRVSGVKHPSISELSDEIFHFEPSITSSNRCSQSPSSGVGGTLQLSVSGGNHKRQPNINTQLYKTELCASYAQIGVCPYGNKCQFAHGESELKRVQRPPNWRSKPCANWTRFGSCRYGHRCCFKHE